ncbi:MAG: DUF2191 domain-containing protein [Dehalococcoidia bacterium]
MRTTLNIEDDLMIRAKVRAAEERTTLTAIIEEALREKLCPTAAPRERIILPTVRLNLPPDLDSSHNSALLDWEDSISGAS